MDANGIHLIAMMDGLSRNNYQKAANQGTRAMKGLGYLQRKPGVPYYNVSITPMRVWNVNDGPMPVTIVAETADSQVDTSVNREVILVGDGVGATPGWGLYPQRIMVTNGRATVQVTLEGAGQGELSVMDPTSNAVGATPTFSWS